MNLNIILTKIKHKAHEKFIKYILALCVVNLLAFILALFHFADKISKTHMQLAVDLSTIVGYWATTIGVGFAIYGLSNWRKEKEYEQKVMQFGELIDSAYTLKQSSQKIKGYLSISKLGFKNPIHAHQLLSYETLILCEQKIRLEKLVATKVYIDKSGFNSHSTELHSFFCQQQNIMHAILNVLEGFSLDRVTINEVNTQKNVNYILAWLEIMEKIYNSAKTIEAIANERIERILKSNQ